MLSYFTHLLSYNYYAVTDIIPYYPPASLTCFFNKKPVTNTEAAREAVDAAIQKRDKTGDHIQCDRVRQAVRDAVRHHRKNMARSASHEARRMPTGRSSSSFDEYPSPRDRTPTTAAAGSYASRRDPQRAPNRAKSLSPAIGRRGSMGSPELGRLTSGSSISRASSADSGFGRIGDGPLSPILGQQNSADAAAGVRPSPSVRATAAAATAATATKTHDSPAPAPAKTVDSPAPPLTPALATGRAEAAAGGGAPSVVSSTNTSTSSTGDELVQGTTGATAVRSTGSGSVVSVRSTGSGSVATSSSTGVRRPSPGGSGLKFTSIGRKMNRAQAAAAVAAGGGGGSTPVAARASGAATMLTDIPAPSAREPGITTTMSAVADAATARGGAGAGLGSGDGQRRPPPPYGEEGPSVVMTKGRSATEVAGGDGGSAVAVAATKTLPASALRAAGSFTNRQRRSVSFADHSDSNSDYDSRIYEDGRTAYGAGATLRQVCVFVSVFFGVPRVPGSGVCTADA